MRIPTMQEQQRMTPASPVSIADTNDARMEGNALVKLGGAVGDLGQKLGQIENVTRDIEVSKRKNDISKLSEESFEEAKVSGEKDLQSAFSRRFKEKTTSYLSDGAGGDNEAYSRLTNFAEDATKIGLSNARMEQIKVGEQNILNKIVEAKNGHMDIVRSDPRNAAMHFKNFDSEVLQKVASLPGISNRMRSDQSLAARADFANAAVDGYINKKQYGPALRLLNATVDATVEVDGVKMPLTMQDTKGKPLSPEEVSLMSALPSARKEQLRDSIRVQGETEATMRISDVNGRMKDMRVAIESGTPVDAVGIKASLVDVDRLGIPVAAKVIMKDTINNMVKTAEYSNRMRNASLGDMTKILQESKDNSMKGKPGDPAFNMERRQHDHNLIESAFKKQMDMRKDDGAGAALQAAPDLQRLRAAAADGDPRASEAYINKSFGIQKRLGIAEPQVMTQKESLETRQKLLASTDPVMLVRTVNDISAKYGKYSANVIQEASKDREEFKMLAFAYSPHAQFRIAENILNRSRIEDDLKRRDTDSATAIRTSAKAQAFQAMIPYEQVLHGAYKDGSSGGLLSAMQAQVEMQALKAGISGNRGEKPGDILKDSFHVFSVGSSGMILPKEIKGLRVDPDEAKDFIRRTTTSRGLEVLGVKGNPNDTPEQASARRDKMSAEAKWIPTQRLDGMALTIRGMLARDKDDNPIIVPLTDLSRRRQALPVNGEF